MRELRGENHADGRERGGGQQALQQLQGGRPARGWGAPVGAPVWPHGVFFFFTPKNSFLQFGFKKWKSHVTARPWEDRSEIVKELYSDLNVIRGHGGGWPRGPDLGWRRWCG